MPRPDAAKMLAERIDRLHHPSGKVIRQMNYATTGLTPEVKQKIQHHALLATEATIHELEREGYKVTHRDDPKAADAEGYKTGAIKCLLCGKQILTVGFDGDMVATLAPLAQRSIVANLTDHLATCTGTHDQS